MTATTSPTQKFPCPSCSANLEFDPDTNQLVCSFCGTTQTIEHSTLGGPVEQNFDDFWDAEHTQLAALSTTAMEVSCPGCHASITFEPPDVAGDCPFCGTSIVAQPRTANPVMTPNGVLPFQFGKKEAQKKIRAWLGKLRFAPNGLKKMAQNDGLQGVYLPFWTYDCHTTSRYTGKRGTYYYVDVSYTTTDSNGKTVRRTRQERRTRWRSVSGSVSHFCDDILVAATHAVEKKRMEQLKPWDLEKLVPYKPSYLAGFKAQRYEANLKQGFEIAKEEGIKHDIDAAIRRDIGGDTQQILSVQTTYHDIKFKHILLPVWIASYRFKNKQYQVIINAQTGELLGDRPWSKLKIAGAAAGATILALFAQCAGPILNQLDSPSSSPSRPVPTQSVPQPPSPQPVVPAPAPSSSTPTKPASPPSASSQPSAAYQQAINLAGQAATQTQVAQSAQDWQQIANLWIQSIELLKQVPSSSPNYATAQQKIQEYQVNLNYARQQLQ
ncbi:MAG: TFIIB-type zinc ribbon-containing protein [Leptolyngbyaceae bacterium]|nr:TFIIB-type zinc ribbon-containing protein [Leptolyngbyaceae bacterium]